MKQITVLLCFCGKCCSSQLCFKLKGLSEPSFVSLVLAKILARNLSSQNEGQKTIYRIPHCCSKSEASRLCFELKKTNQPNQTNKTQTKAAIWLNLMVSSPLFCRPVWISMTVVHVSRSAPRLLYTILPPSNWSTITMPSTPMGLFASKSAHVSAVLPAFSCSDGESELHFRSWTKQWDNES